MLPKTRKLATARKPRPTSDLATETAALDSGPGATSSHAPAVVAALHLEETARMRGWATTVVMLTTAAAAFTPSLPGPMARKLPWLVALALAFGAAVITRVLCADPRRYTRRVFRAFGFVVATISFELVYFLGVNSPVSVIITLGISSIGLGLDRRGALAITLYAIVGYAILAALVVGGLVEDVGVIHASGLPMIAQLFGAVMVPAVLLLSLRLARLSRQTMETAAQQCHAALLLASQREAALAEANQNLDEALRAGLRALGPWSGQQAGGWKLAEVVGRGAMGDVYAASHVDTGAVAAVKILHDDATRNDKLLERFEREGAITADLDVPNVVRTRGTGRIAGTVPYIVMDLLDGEDLSRILRRGVLSRPAVIDLVTQVARGLDAAHAARIIHRDLKPQNLMLVGGTWKILDFGVSTLMGSSSTLTQAVVVGTPGYMAPEQARSEQVDQRCDVFALGAVIYRALLGRRPFPGTDTPQILFNVVYRMPPRPGELAANISADVEVVLAIALAKRAEDRFATAGELASSLTAAFTSNLAPAMRARGAALLREHPWGQALTARP